MVLRGDFHIAFVLLLDVTRLNTAKSCGTIQSGIQDPLEVEQSDGCKMANHNFCRTDEGSQKFNCWCELPTGQYSTI